MSTKKWIEEEEEFLKNNYITMSNSELAEEFNITKNAVQKKLARMGLKRSEPVDLSSDDVFETDTIEKKVPETISTESHFFLGDKFYFEDRDYKRAVEEYQKAIKKELDELIKLKASYWAAESYVKIGELKKAISLFKKITKKHGGHYLGDSARRRVEILQDYIVPTTQ